MAERYLRATGNWNGPVWAATSGGAAGSASTPTINDEVVIANNFTVTLTANASVATLSHTNGQLRLGGYKLTVDSNFVSSGTVSRTVDFQSGSMEFTGNGLPQLTISGSNLTWSASNSLITFNQAWSLGSSSIHFATGGKTFGDVIVNMGANTTNSTTFNITGSPTFRSLIIQSKNSAAHTVNLEADSVIQADKLILIGSSVFNRLTINGGQDEARISVNNGGSSYGQFVYMNALGNPFTDTPNYIGSSSVNGTYAAHWLLQDPPKISTLVDPLTTAPGSNPNWAVTGTVTQVTTGHGGGGYKLAGGATITSTDTYDLTSDSIVIERVDSPTGNPVLDINDGSATLTVNGFDGAERGTVLEYGNPTNTYGANLFSYPLSGSKFVKLSLTGTTLKWQVSDDGTAWTDKSSIAIDSDSLAYYRSCRISIQGGDYTIGSINPSFNAPPTTILNTPANNTTLTTTTPTLSFTATDPDDDDVSYQIQVGNADFSTLHMDVTTATYASGTQQTRVVSPALTQGGIDYYWRVRAKDPSGTDSYGAWSDTRTMITEALPPSVTSGATSSITTTTATAAGNVTSANGATVTERGIAYHTSTNPTTANSKQVVSGTTGSFSGNLTGLTPNTTYYWRAYATNSKGTTYGVNRNFTTEPRTPTVTTGTSGSTSANQFTVSGSTVATNLDSQTIEEFGIVYSTSENPTISNSKQVGTGTSASWSNNVTSLPDSTTYYIRAYVKWRGSDYAYGSQVTLTTPDPPAPPTVTTSAATNIIDTRVDITSTVTAAGDGTVTERGVVFGLSEDPTTDDGKVTAITGGTGEYSLRITGLEPETEYHYRAYAVNEHGTGYSAQKSFTTLPPFVPDEGDGYWVFSVTGSDAIVSRSQATPANSSVSLPLADLGLEDGKTYTLAVGDFESELGDLGMSLLYYDAANPVTTNVPENSQLTFTYNLTDYHTYILQLHVTGDDPVVDELTATFKDLYLAEEPTFSDFVPFTPYGLFEIKLENNQIVDKRRQDVIQSMFTRLEGWEITPFEVTTEGLGYFEIGDGITIKDPQDNDVKSYLTEYTLTLDGGITEKLIGKRPAESKTDYSKAGNIKKLISNTTLQVDKQRQEIEALVQDVTGEGGYIDNKFTQVTQDINQVRTTVQGAGGVNLIRNSVMYAYNNLGYPEEWTTTHVGGEGSTIVIQGSAESKAAGGLSGHIFTLNGTKVVQTVTVRKDADFITEENKTFYTFNIKVKKDLVGEAYIKLSNRQEEHIIDLPNGEEYLWEDFSIDGLLPQDDHYEIEIYSDSDANAQFTDAMLSVGEYTHSWTQAPGEAMNMVRSDTVDGTYWRSPQFRYNYTHISPLGMNVHQRIRGQSEEVFGFNADETNMSKVKATKQVSMGKIRVVPIEMNGTSGWAWTGAEE